LDLRRRKICRQVLLLPAVREDFRPVVGSFEHGTEPSVSINDRKFLK
jgi:hypothetical protein